MRAAMLLRAPATPAWIGLGLTLALAGCGPGPSAVVHSSKVELRLEEYRILPQTVIVPAGRIKLIARNTGLLTHNVAIELTHRDSTGQPVILVRTATVKPGQVSAPVKVTLARGTYTLVSTISNQSDLGMTGTLIAR